MAEGQFGGLEWLKENIVLLAVVIFLAAAVAIALEDFQDNTGTSGSVNEENVTAAGALLSPTFSAFPYELTGVSRIENNSGTGGNGSEILGTSLYNVTTGSGGYITLASNVSQTGNVWNVTYTYLAADAAYNATYYGLQGEKNVSSFFDTIGTILGVAALLVLVVSAFYFAGK